MIQQAWQIDHEKLREIVNINKKREREGTDESRKEREEIDWKELIKPKREKGRLANNLKDLLFD